jgi:hypothetical protein
MELSESRQARPGDFLATPSRRRRAMLHAGDMRRRSLELWMSGFGRRESRSEERELPFVMSGCGPVILQLQEGASSELTAEFLGLQSGISLASGSSTT